MKDPALLVIDVQKGLDNPALGERNHPRAEENIKLLIDKWRQQGLPVIHVQHCSTEQGSLLRPESPGNAIKPEAMPLAHEKIFKKTVNSAFIGTGLEEYLRQQEISALVIVGLTTDHCVSTSVRMAANLGFEVTLVSDATATFERRGYQGEFYTADQMHEISLVSLQDEFCRIVATESILKQSNQDKL